MIKLLKYDWKRSSDGILSTLAILIILEAALSITGITRNWDEALVISFSIFGYSLAMVLLFIHCCRTFDQNIKSFSRRLLPLHPIKGVGTAILLSWICALLILAIAAIHIPIYTAFSDIDNSFLREKIQLEKGSIFYMILSIVWTYTTFTISVLASITVARSFRVKKSTWIGILFFFGVQVLIAWLTSVLFNQDEASMGFFSIKGTSTEGSFTFGASNDLSYLAGPFLIELAFTVGFLFLMNYLLNKKVEL
jgi:hypothetical protein